MNIDKIIRQNNKVIIGLFLKNMREKNRSWQTIKNYQADLVKFLIWFESHYHYYLWNITADVMGVYLSFLMNGGQYLHQDKPHPFFNLVLQKVYKRSPLIIIEQVPLTSNSRKRHLSAINNFFIFLKEYHEGISHKFKINPVKRKLHAIRVKDVDITHTQILDPSTFALILNTPMKLLDKILINLLYYGGLRLNELNELKYEDFDLINQTIFLKRKGGNTQKLKVVHPEFIFPLVEKMMSNRFAFEYLCVSKNKKKLSSRALYNRIKVIIEKSTNKKYLSPHSFRKACATNLYQKTKDLLWVRDYLGHSDAKVTQTYIDTTYIQ
ncbi:MAG: hypothetical protein A2381_06805 [Bdellovibrionales bacterium RIFOXYB1_FULL_37_110]|nr:MAG: hypothetical protein A2417_14680 [Bdellovibrionales bacterium RIFOXYC1_FULL_37_79]OFZ57773.1 MAG: hypothetical protein A2381_06805 [Bdellovibrionales bacterium RIFOXYB1_FULL_37_110]OFZ62739.1 MAG: hypothetical protein A2577_16325 [Bdellovibrionales bacterium RIFOXYD1_FULL_36_51]